MTTSWLKYLKIKTCYYVVLYIVRELLYVGIHNLQYNSRIGKGMISSTVFRGLETLTPKMNIFRQFGATNGIQVKFHIDQLYNVVEYSSR